MNKLSANDFAIIKDILESVKDKNSLVFPKEKKSYFLKPKQVQSIIDKVEQIISEKDNGTKVIISVTNGFVSSIMHNMTTLKTSIIDYDTDQTNDKFLSAIKLPKQKLKKAIIHQDTELLQNKDDFNFVWKQCCNDGKLERVRVELTDDDKGLYSLYAESGQIVERDFISENEAETWAIDNNYKVVKTFNL